MSSPSFTPPSPSFNPLSPSTSQRPQIAASSRPTSTTQGPNNMNAATTQQLDDVPEDPTQRSTGITARLMNSNWEPTTRRSELKAMMEAHYPKLLTYYEGRRTGKIEAKAWRTPVSADLAEYIYHINYGKVERAFFAMDYTHGFTGRGVSPGTLERPGLIGPRNETIEEIAGPIIRSRNEQPDRPLWLASDGKSDEGEEEEDIDAEGMNELMQLAAKSVGVMSRAPADTGAAASTSGTPSRKRTRYDAEEDAKDDESPSQLKRRRIDDVLRIGRKTAEEGAKNNDAPSRQKRKRMDDVFGIVRKDPEEDAKRRRMDDVLGIIRKDANASRIPQNVGAAMVPDTQQSKKRGRSPNDGSNGGTSKPTPKRLRLYQRARENDDVKEEHVIDGHADAATKGDPTLVHQPTSSDEAQELASVDAVTSIAIHTQPTVEEELLANYVAGEREDVVADDEAASTQTKWDTAHGINSSCANIRVPGKRIRDPTGQWTNLYLPTSGGLPDRPWTEAGKEDLRVYIQDYGVEDWSLLSQSMNRPEAQLQDMYVEVVAARNKQAGRHERAGIPKKYPNLAPPPPPPKPAVRTASVELPRLRPLDKTGRVKRNMLGDLTYDAKATSFPKVTRDGGMVDSKSNALLGIMGDIATVKRRQLKPRQKTPVSLPSAEQAEDAEQEQILERERTHEKGPSPEHTGKEEDSLNGSVEEAMDPKAKQVDSDQEQQGPTPSAPKPQKTSAKGPLGPRFAGVCKLSGSSRRGVPRNAAGLRQ